LSKHCSSGSSNIMSSLSLALGVWHLLHGDRHNFFWDEKYPVQSAMINTNTMSVRALTHCTLLSTTFNITKDKQAK
jgi:hypothetical protein